MQTLLVLDNWIWKQKQSEDIPLVSGKLWQEFSQLCLDET